MAYTCKGKPINRWKWPFYMAEETPKDGLSEGSCHRAAKSFVELLGNLLLDWNRRVIRLEIRFWPVYQHNAVVVKYMLGIFKVTGSILFTLAPWMLVCHHHFYQTTSRSKNLTRYFYYIIASRMACILAFPAHILLRKSEGTLSEKLHELSPKGKIIYDAISVARQLVDAKFIDSQTLESINKVLLASSWKRRYHNFLCYPSKIQMS